MKLLYDNRADADKEFIFNVCNDILSIKYSNKPLGYEYAGIFVEGRNRQCCIEDMASIASFNTYSRYNYPIFCFLSNPNFFSECNQDGIKSANIQIIQIPEITSLEEYTNFCIEKLYFMLPKWVEKVITLQPDGMLLREGWENYIENQNVDWLSPHWRHFAGIDIKCASTDWKWTKAFGRPTAIGNGGFSFRKASLMRRIAKAFWEQKHCPQRESGRNDDRIPMEDLFFCYWGFNTNIMKAPTLTQCDMFAQDPLTPSIYKSKNRPFGFHFFKDLSERDWPPCTHF